jgi:hypothetical protein
MRQLFGDRPFESFDFVVSINAYHGTLNDVVKLRHLRMVRLGGDFDDHDLKRLEELPQLEGLETIGLYVPDGGDPDAKFDPTDTNQCFRLPKLPRLRYLDLNVSRFRGDGLENIPAVEVLNLRCTHVDDKSIPALSRLTKMQAVELFMTDVSEAGAIRLERALPSCTVSWCVLEPPDLKSFFNDN